MILSITTFVTGLLLTAVPQEPADLIEQLRSDRPAARDLALRKLLELGESARSLLENAALDSEREVANRAREVLRRLNNRKLLTPAILKAIPDADQRLKNGEDHPWTDLLLEAAAQEKSRRRYPDLLPADLDALTSRAWQGASPEECERLIMISEAWHLPSSLPPLLKMARHSDHQIRCRAWAALLALNVPIPETDIVAALRSETDQFVLGHLLKWVERHEVRTALPELRRLLTLEAFHGSFNDEILEMLPHLATSAEIPSLIELWKKDPVSLNPYSLGGTLTRLDAEKATDLILEEVKRTEAIDRFRPLMLLFNIDSPRSLIEARKVVGSTDGRIRGDSHNLIRRMQDVLAIADLKPLLGNPDRWVRREAAETLATLGDGSGLSVLIEELADQQIRSNTLAALGRIDCRSQFPALLERVRAGEFETAFILIGQGDPEWQTKVIPLFQDAPAGWPRRLGGWLAFAGCGEALPLLKEDLESPDFQTQSQAAESLGKLGLRESLNLFREAARTTVYSSHYPAIRYLGRIGGREAIPQLDPLLDDANPGRRREALIALEEAGALEFLPRVRALLTDEDPGVRLQAATWLVRSGYPEGVPMILDVGRHLFSLNALRSPDLWKRFARTPIPPSLCYRGEVLEKAAIAKATGLKWDEGEKRVRSWAHYGYGSRTLSEALELGGSVLEEDRIRELSQRDAYRFWSAWWKDYPAKAK